ncbi:MAG: TolC family protein [Desulfocapsaceae bacterium]|nr:TolC family protein [Desulfocapsaceae bacterium]
MRLLLLTLSFLLSLPSACWSVEGDTGRLFTLEEALQTAYTRNHSLLEAGQTHNSALAEMQSARADFFAHASAHYSFGTLQDAPFQRINGITMQVSDRDVSHWDITLTQPLFTGFAITSRYQMAKISAKIKELERQRILLDVSQTVKTAWYDALLTGKIEAVASDTVAALGSHARDAEKFFQHGLIPQNDLLKSKVALANALQEKERAHADARIAMARLYTVIGIDLDSEKSLEDTQTFQPQKFDLAALTGEAMQTQPVLASYRLGLDNLDEAITLARSPYFPEIALSGKYEQNGSDIGAETNNYSNQHNTTVMLTAKWDFFDAGKTGANIEKQKLDKRALIEKMRGVEDQIRLEIKSAFLDLTVAENNIGTAREALQQARENSRITDLQYRNQLTTSTEVLDARTFLSQAETNYYRALYGYMVALANLERAAGRK